MTRLRGWPLAASAALAVLAVLVYASGLRGPFLLDDYDAIFPLAAWQSAGADWLDILRQAPAHIRARWLANASFLISHASGGGAMPPSALAFKLGNLLVHLACGAAVFALARRVLGIAGEDARRAQWLALLAAALFLLHPLLASTVLYPVQRMAQLSTLFLLACVFVYAGWRRDLAALSPPAHVRRLGLCVVLALLAFGAKENGVLAPLLIACVEFTLFRWPARGTPERARFDVGFGLLVAVPLMLGIVALVLRWPRLMGGYQRRDFTLPERLLTQVHALADYLGQIAWPRIGSLGLYRDDFPVQSQLDLATAMLALLLAGVVVAAIALRRRWPVPALGVLWFFAAHALESGFVALELVFEHRNYLALFGPALLVAWVVGRARPTAAAAIALAMVVALGVQTARRSYAWRDYASWIATEVKNHPGSMRAGTDLMLHFAARGRTGAAQTERQRLAALHPGHAQPVMLRLAFACRGDTPPPAFTPEERRRLREGRAGKDLLHVYSGLRDGLQARCKTPDWAAFGQAAEDLAHNPRAGATRGMRASWWRFAAGARLRLADWPGVRAALQDALREENNDPRDWLLLAEAEARLGNRDGYFAARQRLLSLMGGRPGPLANKLAQVDALAAGAAAPRPAE